MFEIWLKSEMEKNVGDFYPKGRYFDRKFWASDKYVQDIDRNSQISTKIIDITLKISEISTKIVIFTLKFGS